MHIWLIYVWSIYLIGVKSISFDGCNETISCWFQPSGCLTNDPIDCVSSVKWRSNGNSYSFELFSYITSLDPHRPYWMAVGISKNQRMDDDTVFECLIAPNSQKSMAQVSFNDDTHNFVLHQASESLMRLNEIELNDGKFTCNFTVLPENYDLVNEEDRLKLHNFEAQPYFLLFAKGSADFSTMEKDIHFMNDGPDFPWMTGNTVSFCRNCTGMMENMEMVEDSIQSHVSRYWRYRIAVIHGSLMLFCWWFLISNAILIARFFKPLWPRRKIFGAAVWFQIHRSLNLLSVPLQMISILLIFYQSGWVWYECSYQCDLQSLAKKLHTITGVSATVLAILNPILALFRPAPDSSRRPIFNWAHWFLGMIAWMFASLTMILSIPLGKTGLFTNYGAIPYYIMGGYIIIFFLTNILMEMMTSGGNRRSFRDGNENVHRFTISESGMSLSVLNGPSTESPLNRSYKSHLRVLILLIHLIISFSISTTISIFLIKILWSHSP